jgi:uncharacterized protein (TIGR02594 family)
MSEPRWLTAARRYIGTQEIPGKRSNPVIMGWAKRAGGWIASYFKDDDIPWCALFVEAVLADVGLKGTASLAARSYEKWGVKLAQPALGAVLTFVRNGGGHVGFYVGGNATAYRVLGGNQSNSVNETWIAKSRCTGIRWPKGEPLPAGGPVFLNSKGKLSTNEGSLAGGLTPDAEFEPDHEAIDDAPPGQDREPQSPFRGVLNVVNAITVGLSGVGAWIAGLDWKVWVAVAGFGTIIFLVTHFFPRPIIYHKFPEQR